MTYSNKPRRSIKQRLRTLKKSERRENRHVPGLVPFLVTILLSLYFSIVAHQYVTSVTTTNANRAYLTSVISSFRVTHREALRLWETQLAMYLPFYSIFQRLVPVSLRKSIYSKLITNIVLKQKHLPIFVKSALLTVVLVCITNEMQGDVTTDEPRKPTLDMTDRVSNAIVEKLTGLSVTKLKNIRNRGIQQAQLIFITYQVYPIVTCLLTTNNLTLAKVNKCLGRIA